MNIKLKRGPTYRIDPPKYAAPVSDARLRGSYESQEAHFLETLGEDPVLSHQYSQYKEIRWANWKKWAVSCPSLAEVTEIQVQINTDGKYGGIDMLTASGEKVTFFVLPRSPRDFSVCGFRADLHGSEKVLVREADGSPVVRSGFWKSIAMKAIRILQRSDSVV